MTRIGHRLVLGLVAISLSVPAHGAATSLDDGVLAEINTARRSPASYARFLGQLKRTFRGNVMRPQRSASQVVTEEGVAAVDEAIRFLVRQSPLPPLAPSAGLRNAADDLVKEQGKTGATGHEGNESGDMRERIERHGKWKGRIGENISYGPSNARWVVMSLIIDDGVPDRGHRKNIFDPSFSTAGVACGPHPRFRTVCTIDFASRFANTRK